MPMEHQFWSKLVLSEMQPLGSPLCCIKYQNKADIASRGLAPSLSGHSFQLLNRRWRPMATDVSAPSKNLRQATQCFLRCRINCLLNGLYYCSISIQFYTAWLPFLTGEYSIFYKLQTSMAYTIVQHKFSVLYKAWLPLLSGEGSIFCKLQT
jgi:hypothetical protein